MRTAPSRCTVVVVDNERDCADTMAALLEALGHEAVVAYDGASALAAIARRRPHLVFLDLDLPDMRGHEVCRRVHEYLPRGEIYFVAVTGWAAESVRAASLAAGCEFLLAKPTTLPEIEAVLAGYAQHCSKRDMQPAG